MIQTLEYVVEKYQGVSRLGSTLNSDGRLFHPVHCEWLEHCAILARSSLTEDVEQVFEHVVEKLRPEGEKKAAKRILDCARLVVRVKQLRQLTSDDLLRRQCATDIANLAISLLQFRSNQTVTIPPVSDADVQAVAGCFDGWTAKEDEKFFARALAAAWAKIKAQWNCKDSAEKRYWPEDWHQSRIGYLRDLCRFLATGWTESKNEREIIEPFVVVTGDQQVTARILQFRFELIPGDGQIFIHPRQATLSMDNDFTSLFDEVVCAVGAMPDCKQALSTHDIRVTIEKFQRNRKGLGPLSSSDGFLVGNSATGAAARQLYFALAGKVPDPYVITLVAVGRTGICESVKAREDWEKKFRAKVRAIADVNKESTVFDTIVVCGPDLKRQAENELGQGSEIVVKDISGEASQVKGARVVQGR